MLKDKNKHIDEFLKKGIRFDGRKLDEWRNITIETNVATNAEGSARVKFGNTEVIAGVKLGMGTPFPDTPDKGVLMVGAELLPFASPHFESGPPSINSIEMSRVIDRGIRESGMIDVRKLCIEKGEKVWMINIDIIPINHDGNLLDAGAIAAIAALKTAKMPDLIDGVPDYKKPGKKGLPISEQPVEVTVLKIGDNFIVDPTTDEEALADARLTVGVKASGNVCSLQKGLEMPITPEDVDKMVGIALKKSKELNKALAKVK